MSTVTYEYLGEDEANAGIYGPLFMFGSGLIRQGDADTYSITGKEGVTLAFEGPGFKYNGKGELTSGHATSCEIWVDGILYATIKDIDVGAKQLKALNTPGEFQKLLGKVDATGSDGRDYIVGGPRQNHLEGGDGDDILGGGKSDDRLYGGDGDDGLLFNGGRDLLNGGAGADYAAFSGVFFGDSKHPDLEIDLREHGYQKVAKGIEIKLVSIEGVASGDGDDRLTGDSLDNLFDGGRGDDTIKAGDGDDRVFGGGGDDVLKGGDGEDTLSFSSSGKGVTVSLAIKGFQNTGQGKDNISGFENLEGSFSGDKLIGDKNSNHISGAGGDDTLIGGGGFDGLEGGQGADTFVFNKAFIKFGARTDIVDFRSSDDDLIDLSAIDANKNIDGNQDFAFIGSNAFTGVAGQLRWQYFGNDPTRDIYIQGDRDGDGVGDFIIQLRGPLGSLSASDFDF